MCWSLAIALYRVGSPGSVGRELALLLAVEGATLISTGYLDLMLTETVQASPGYPGWLQFESVVHTLIAYGILKTQLFDIDLKIRWTIRQSTVAAAFVAVFYLVTEGADRLLADELGNWIGLLASAMRVLFLAPLQRFAERVATVAMPNTQNTPEYAAFRKLQVYSAALEDALPGGISAKERALLNHLRESLGIAGADAEALEHDLQNEPA